jgi:predicted molibdopterin-dependent oxidoreductase YjgC
MSHVPGKPALELQEVAGKIGMKEITLPYIEKKLPAYRSDPFFDRDYNLCILCGRCVRFVRRSAGPGSHIYST